jgi:hypothetical protein
MATDPKSPQWTADEVRRSADALYLAMADHLKTPGEHLLAKDLAALMAQTLQFAEALQIQHRTLNETAMLATDVAAAHRVQMRSLSQRLEALEAKA